VPQLFGAQLGLFRLELRRLQRHAQLRLGQAEQVDAPIGARLQAARNGHGIDVPGDGHQGIRD
jgi:hypothetical protein